MPKFTTTETSAPEAILSIKSKDQAALKKRYEEIFLGEWEKRKNYLKTDLNIISWTEINHEGTESSTGMGGDLRRGDQSGGLKILFKNAANREIGFIWMRGSKTEPVFRILADLEGENRKGERYLLDWQRSMLEKADSPA